MGAPGNPADDTGLGSVGYEYKIGTYEVTNVQYVEFLNAVAATDTYGLYAHGMSFDLVGGVVRSGDSGSYSYSVILGEANKPINYVSFWDALRFANWLENGQPIGLQGPGTTEGGAYTITTEGIAENSIVRNIGATIVLPTLNELYKAAYYDAAIGTYFDYPAGSDTVTSCSSPAGVANTANCDRAAGFLTDVGSYSGSPSPNGTFDQAGNVGEWHETVLGGILRGSLGGNWEFPSWALAVDQSFGQFPDEQNELLGFRLAMIPEPATGALLGLGLVGLAVCARRNREGRRSRS